MDSSVLGKSIFYIGIFICAVGGVIWLVSKFGIPLGSLPGDISVKKENFSFHFPLATSIIVSVVLTIVVNVLLLIFKKR